MSKRAKTWARVARAHLLRLLGGQCAVCGTNTNLEFDCIVPQGHAHHTWSTDKRMTFYRRQYLNHNLQILCSECNGIKGQTTDIQHHTKFTLPCKGSTEVPF
jgi:5-methylcytosine-specific restriction endonuclease McrA